MPYSFLTKTPGLLREKINTRFGVKPLSESQEELNEWFQGSVGQRLLSAEKAKLDRIMPEMYGYHLMQLSAVSHSSSNIMSLSRQSPVTHHFSLGVKQAKEKGEGEAKALAQFEQLPIDSECVDVALLHHALEYSTKPHQLLRETARTIIPNGYIIVVGFNPWSFSTTKRQLGRLFSQNAQRRFHNLRRSRIVDWLQLLDFEPAFLEYGDHGWPIKQQYGRKVEEYINNLFPIWGSFYVVVARKSITPMTVIKPEWKKPKGLPSWAKNSIAQQNVRKSPVVTKKTVK
ncbi:MAG: methyltransferase domain-containing protein [Cellvibrionaceae bacterium]